MGVACVGGLYLDILARMMSPTRIALVASGKALCMALVGLNRLRMWIMTFWPPGLVLLTGRARAE